MSEVAKIISRNQRIWQNIEQGKSFPFQKPQYPIQALLDCVGKYGWLPEYLARHPQDITHIKQHLPDHHLDHYLQQQWHDPQKNLLTVVIPHPTQQQAAQSHPTHPTHPTHTADMHHTTPPLPSYYFDSQPAALQCLRELSQFHVDHAHVLASIPKDHVMIDLEIDPKTKKLRVVMPTMLVPQIKK